MGFGNKLSKTEIGFVVLLVKKEYHPPAWAYVNTVGEIWDLELGGYVNTVGKIWDAELGGYVNRE